MITRNRICGSAVLAVLLASAPPPATAASGSCAECQTAAARRFLGSERVMRCGAGSSAVDEARLQRALARCAAKRDCTASATSDAVLASLRTAVAVAKEA